jgi:MYXO-CTERM domain-containing protein
MSFDKVTSVRACVRDQCAVSCATQVKLKLWSAEVCGAATTTPPPPAGKSGCSFAPGRDRGPTPTAAAALCLLLLLGRGRRRPQRRG